MSAGKYIVAYDTICSGWECFKDGDGDAILFDSKADAEAEIRDDLDMRREGGTEEEESDCFVVPAREYVHNRKAIWHPKGGAS